MTLLEIVRRDPHPEPWSEGEKIPWHEPDFSRRMLAEHLDQRHDAASRRAETIDLHVHFVHERLLGARPSRVLDLGCGPGLYCSRLARLGHVCLGIDISPASISHARAEAQRDALACTYLRADLRAADYRRPDRPDERFDVAMLLFGELNAFRTAEAERILVRARDALEPDGLLLLEPHHFEAVRAIGSRPPAWTSAPSGLFSDEPHLCLTEAFWSERDAVATRRWLVVDAATGGVTQLAESMQAYSEGDYHALLERCGYTALTFHPTLAGDATGANGDLFALTARPQA